MQNVIVKKLTCKETLRHVFICIGTDSYHPPPTTLYKCIPVSPRADLKVINS
jgi:hypothetical protein